MINSLIFINFDIIKKEFGISRITADSVVKTIIYEKVGVDRILMVPGARIVKDLGVD